MEKEMLVLGKFNLVKENVKNSWDGCNQMKEWQKEKKLLMLQKPLEQFYQTKVLLCLKSQFIIKGFEEICYWSKPSWKTHLR